VINTGKVDCGKAGADKQIILQSRGDVKGPVCGWTVEAGKGIEFRDWLFAIRC
jgi:hypothetical protein